MSHWFRFYGGFWSLLVVSRLVRVFPQCRCVFLQAVWTINLGLLIFNMLPIYPLDGGQILRSLLWFAMERGRSLMAATIVGFVGVAGLIALAVMAKSSWFGSSFSF